MNRRLLDYGESGLLVECPDLADALALRAHLEEQPVPEVEEIIPGARTLLLRLSGRLTSPVRDRLRDLELPARLSEAGELVEIAVDYDGADLAEVAELTGLTPAEVVSAHTGQLWSVAFCGFAPGFAYLKGEDDRLRVPRRSTPRTKVPAGSVGLADSWSGVYPREGPGGWQLIGRTERPLWDLGQDPPALLQPGARVRFVANGAPSTPSTDSTPSTAP
jgi:KipI family sensor histidine kinase inhibitor